MSFDDRLRQQFLSAERGMPPASIDWNETISRGKRERVYRNALVAAAAVLVVGGGAWSAQAVLSRPPSPGPGPAASPGDDRTLPTPHTSPSSTGEEGVDTSGVSARVNEWIKAINLGDAEIAWAAMTDEAHRYFVDFDTFKTEGMPTLAEGFGAWYSASQQPKIDVRVLASGGSEAAGVATIYGRVTKEGTQQLAADALPFRIVSGEIQLDPGSSKVELTPLEPGFDESYRSGQLPAIFEAEVPSDLLQVNFILVGGDPAIVDAQLETMQKVDSQPPNSIASSPFPETLEPGPHFLTIAAIDASGDIAVRTVVFRVE
jgi:ketosteroid isomerase-like protein